MFKQVFTFPSQIGVLENTSELASLVSTYVSIFWKSDIGKKCLESQVLLGIITYYYNLLLCSYLNITHNGDVPWFFCKEYFSSKYQDTNDYSSQEDEESLTSSGTPHSSGVTVSLAINEPLPLDKKTKNGRAAAVSLDKSIRMADVLKQSRLPRPSRQQSKLPLQEESIEETNVEPVVQETSSSDYKKGESDVERFFPLKFNLLKNLKKAELKLSCEAIANYEKLNKSQTLFANTLPGISSKEGYISFLENIFAKIHYPNKRSASVRILFLSSNILYVRVLISIYI